MTPVRGGPGALGGACGATYLVLGIKLEGVVLSSWDISPQCKMSSLSGEENLPENTASAGESSARLFKHLVPAIPALTESCIFNRGAQETAFFAGTILSWDFSC